MVAISNMLAPTFSPSEISCQQTRGRSPDIPGHGSISLGSLRSLTWRGRRRYKHLLCDPEQEHSGLFGLARLDNVLRLGKEMQQKISLLRLCAQNLKNANHYTVLIRYRLPKRETESDFVKSLFRMDGERDDMSDLSLPPDSTWEYATAIGRHQQPLSKKRKYTTAEDFTGHIRWTHSEDDRADNGEEYIKIRLPAKASNSRSFKFGNNHTMLW